MPTLSARYTTIHRRAITTLCLIIMIRAEAQSTLGVISHFFQPPESRSETPPQNSHGDIQAKTSDHNDQRVEPKS